MTPSNASLAESIASLPALERRKILATLTPAEAERLAHEWRFWARANQRDAITGMSVGIAAMSFVVFARQIGTWVPALAEPLAPFASIAWPWYVLIGTTLTMATGILSSFTHAAPATVVQPSEART